MSTHVTTQTDIAQSQLPQVTEPRNPGMPLDMDWVRSVQVNTSAVERRAASLPARRSVKKDHQAAWLLRAITCPAMTPRGGSTDYARRPGNPWPRI
jgi:deoxyribose-phosphate aldolase